MIDPCGLISSLTVFIVSYVDDNTLLRSFEPTDTMATIFKVLRQELSVWQQLLQITGGDLSLGKCTVSIMHWKWQGWAGIPTMTTGKTCKGTIETTSVIDETQQLQSIRRIKPWEAERQLGIRLPMSCSFESELQYRQQQSNDMAKKLYQAPLSHYKAYMVYKAYYMPAIQYPLPITTFSDDECDTIHKPFIFLLLPKLGLNRHTCRTILYAPTTYGGSSALQDLKVEQKYHQLQSFQQYLRQRSRVGSSVGIAIHQYQIFLGSSIPFFELDPTIYNYGDATQQVHYIWTAAQSSQIKIKVPNMWTPRPRFENDQCLMDIAVGSGIFHKDSYSLQAIKACRIYLKVFTIYDICTYNGMIIQRGMWDGTGITTPSSSITFPYQPYPTAYQWS